jgi:hypothetical protein
MTYSTALPPAVVIPVGVALLLGTTATGFGFATGQYMWAVAVVAIAAAAALGTVFASAWRSREPAALDWADYELLDADGEVVKVGPS